MDKKAEMDEKDRRMLGAGLAGVGAALIGGGVIPGLVYKKPTWYSRLLMGGASGALTALAVAAALNKQKAPDTPAEDAGKNISSVGQNAFNILFPGPMSAAEQRDMGPWARALAGKGDSWGARASRLLFGGLPDLQGWFGKSDYVKYREKTGELPKYDYPNRALKIPFDIANVLAGYSVGKGHWNRLQKTWLNREIARQLRENASSLSSQLDTASRSLLDNFLQQEGKHTWKDLLHGAKQWGSESLDSVPILGKFWLKNRKWAKPAVPGREQGVQVLDKILKSMKPGDQQKLLQQIRSTKPKWGTKLAHGGRSLLIGLLTAGTLGAIERGFGAGDSRYLDSNVDLLKDLQHAAR